MATTFIDDNNFILGANLAWLDDQYDHDFGNNEIIKGNPIAYSTNSDNFSSYLQDMKNMGIQVIRLWVFERFEGLYFNPDGTVKHVDPVLLQNLADACTIASKIGIKFYLCLMDTWGIWQNTSPDKQQWLSTFNGLITTPNKTNSFLNNAVMPLISDDRIKNSIFAVDVINEPEGLDRANAINDKQYPTDTKIWWSSLVTYINTCADFIKNSNMKVSCGFQNVSTVQDDSNNFSDHLDFFDFHKYDDYGVLPSYDSLGINIPCIIGECGQGTTKWDNQIQTNAITSFLNNALTNGYAGCFVWNYNFKNFTDARKNDDCYLSLINPDGSRRPVCSVINEFSKNI